MLDDLGIAKASAKPSDEMHSPVLQTDFHMPPHCLLDRRSERLATLGVKRSHPAQVAREITLRHEDLHRFLNRDRRSRKGGTHDAGKTFGNGVGQDKVSKPQPGKEDLAEGPGVKNTSAAIQALERWRGKTTVMELAVVVIFNNPGPLAISPVEQGKPAFDRERHA
jgi:hypothetical protein